MDKRFRLILEEPGRARTCEQEHQEGDHERPLLALAGSETRGTPYLRQWLFRGYRIGRRRL